MTEQELWDAALAEAYASAPTTKIMYHAIELHHETFETPVRVVRWPVVDNDVQKFYFKHEDTAEHNPNELCEYIALPFDVVPPASMSESPGEFTFTLDGVGTALDQDLESAADYGGKISLTYRVYIKGYEAEGPSEIVESIQLESPTENMGNLSAKGTILNWLTRAYGDTISPEKYPGIVRGQ